MIRTLLTNPIVLAVAVGLSLAICRLTGWNAHARDLVTAAVAVGIAAELATLPLFFARSADQATVAQAGLAGTVIHMLASAAAGFAASSLLHLNQPFMYMLLAFYWLTLIALSVLCVQLVKAAPMNCAVSSDAEASLTKA